MTVRNAEANKQTIQEQSLSMQAMTMAMMGRAIQMFDQPRLSANSDDNGIDGGSKIKQIEEDVESMKNDLFDIKYEVRKNHDEMKALLQAFLTGNNKS